MMGLDSSEGSDPPGGYGSFSEGEVDPTNKPKYGIDDKAIKFDTSPLPSNVNTSAEVINNPNATEEEKYAAARFDAAVNNDRNEADYEASSDEENITNCVICGSPFPRVPKHLRNEFPCSGACKDALEKRKKKEREEIKQKAQEIVMCHRSGCYMRDSH